VAEFKAGMRVRTTRAWTDKHGIRRQSGEVVRLLGQPHEEIAVLVRLDAPLHLFHTEMWFEPGDLVLD